MKMDSRQRRRSWLWLLGLTLGVLAVVAGDTPPNSVDFVGPGGTRLDGEPVPAGAVVRAYDPTGLPSGGGLEEGIVEEPGYYLIPVYGEDEGFWGDPDSGVTDGDRLVFTVDGHPAVPIGPDEPVWVGSETRRDVNLRACTLAGDFDCDCRVTVADLMRQAQALGTSRGEEGYYPPFDRDSDDDVDNDDVLQTHSAWHNTCAGQ